MAVLLKKIWDAYFYINDDIADPRTKNLFLMSSPVPVILILSGYLYFVLKWGPEFMKNRKAFNIDKILIVYNAMQIVACGYLVIQFQRYCFLQFNWRCEPVDYSYDELPMKHVHFAWFYMIIKIVDLLDTIFFVLRKKFNQISFLHVYHHWGMVVLIWIGVKYLAGGHGLFLVYFNCIVHVFMYFYYLMTIWDEKYKKSVWWKKHITQLQLVQFLFGLILYAQTLFQPNCNYPKWIVFLLIPQYLFMFALFGNFYWNTYIKTKSDTKLQHSFTNNAMKLDPSKKIQ